ncbi:hypothetical protein IW261DRAFT_1415592 [Armillaria novae-zelandiae]|uniref:Uncharacterized protein n=1 Tax=Armillaria novae-zelandiae TaxID=153914 RepID=A0AA39PJY6_9AGAR|nr:hypothetical protein IW261DRAFT_1415592 [Armillaria novae-zelandiae]
MLLRGAVLRNTGWVIGLVLFTGEGTKIMRNLGGMPSKRSKYPQGALWPYGDNQSNDDPSISGLIAWARALITFQNIVPVLLYIATEFVRTCQVVFMYFDYEIWYPKTNQPTLAQSWNLPDNLGQVEIFLDKTGTLTQEAPLVATLADSAASVEGPSATATELTPAPTKTTKKHFHHEPVEKDITAALQSSLTLANAAHAQVLNGIFLVLACVTPFLPPLIATPKILNTRHQVLMKQHCTNLISRDSNMIVIRGGNACSGPVYQQMLCALEVFSPESRILDKEDRFMKERNFAPVSSRDDNELQRIETGISSIVGPNNGDRPGGFILVIDDMALDCASFDFLAIYALGDEEHKTLLLKLTMLCEGVICCHVSPLQKTLVIRLVKDGLHDFGHWGWGKQHSLSKAAGAGVGISGEEGLQAVNSSDCAIAQARSSSV